MGLKQVELASRVGVSPSYLNLIEANKRRIGGALLARIGDVIGLTHEQLDGSRETRLRAELLEMASDPEIATPDADTREVDELVARHPGWASVATRAWRRGRDMAAEVEAMSDRLAHDPALGAAVHVMLTEISALRSTSEILAEGGEMPAEQRQRFEQIIFEQSSRLATSGASLADYFDRTASARRTHSPAIDAEETIERMEALGERIEDTADRILRSLGLTAGGASPFDVSRALVARDGDALNAKGDDTVQTTWAQRRDQAIKALALPAVRPAFEESLAPAFRSAETTHSEDTEERIYNELVRRVADAVLMPRAATMALGKRVGWDLTEMVRLAEGDAALAMRRIACIEDTEALRAAHVSADASGRIIARRGALDLTPRARRMDCPVWPLHRARQGGAEIAALRAADDSRALAIAVAAPDGMRSDMLLIATGEAARTVYAPLAAGKPLNVGPDCRICIHRDCEWRRDAPVVEG